MKIYYISLGSFCYPKIIIRETFREVVDSLPFDFNSSPHLNGITNILKELYYNNNYNIELQEIIEKYNENELCVKEKNMYLVHFFKESDLIKNINTYPANINHINPEKIKEVTHKFNKRFERLLKILNDKNNILCFLRIENYDNFGWKYELKELTHILSLFKNPNKYLIYSQNLIDENLHFNNSRVLNYDYHIPIFFFKHYFYDLEMINNKQLFITILNTFEYILNNNVIYIKNNDIIEKYYVDNNKYTIFKLTNINHFSNAFLDNNVLYITNAINGNMKYIKNIDTDVYELFI